MKTIRQRISAFTIRHAGKVLLLLALVTAVFAAGLPRVELRTIFSDLFPSNHPFVQTFRDHPNFGNPLTVTIMVKRKDGDIYNAETLQKIWNMTRDIDLSAGDAGAYGGSYTLTNYFPLHTGAARVAHVVYPFNVRQGSTLRVRATSFDR